MSRIIKFELNEPITLALMSMQSLGVPDKFGNPQELFVTVDRKRLYAPIQLANKIKALGVKADEPFCIRKYKKGRNVHYDVWLAHASEMARAEAEKSAVSAELRQTGVIELASPVQVRAALAATGTDGVLQMPKLAPKPIASTPGKRGVVIPFNVAFREVTQFVIEGLKDTREVWNDEARQGIVSTVLIAAAKEGWVGPWERGE